MSIDIFGFFNFNQFINNADSTTNPVGELSGFCETFSRDVKEEPTSNGLFYIFNVSNLDLTSAQFLASIYTKISVKLDAVISGLQTQAPLLSNVSSLLGASVNTVSIGNLILNPLDGRQYPEYVSFLYEQDGSEWNIKVWFCDDSFRMQYPKGTIEIVNPLDNMSLLYNSWSIAKNLIAQFNLATMNNRLNAQIQNVQLTGTETIMLTVLNINDLSQSFKMPVLFAFNGGIVYCNLTNFLKTLADYLVALGIPLDQWIIIIPDLIPVNRYYFIPDWLNISINSLAHPAPLYSPTTNLARFDDVYNKFFNNLLKDYYTAKINYATSVYKSIGLFILPADNNINGALPFHEYIHDYFVSLIGDVNIGQMSPQTQDFIIAFDNMIRLAETYQTIGNMPLPAGITRENRDVYVYLVQRVDSLEVALLTRQSFEDNP